MLIRQHQMLKEAGLCQVPGTEWCLTPGCDAKSGDSNEENNLSER